MKLLGDMNFLADLKTYDKDNIPVSVKQTKKILFTLSLISVLTYSFSTLQVPVMQKIRNEYMTNPDFNPSIVAKASSAAEGLCKWIQAMEVYDRVAKVLCFLLSMGFVSWLFMMLYVNMLLSFQTHSVVLGCSS